MTEDISETFVSSLNRIVPNINQIPTLFVLVYRIQFLFHS